MTIKSRFAFISGASLGLFAVIFGAFGAHGLKAIFNDYQMSIWQTAVEYQMYHAVVLLFTSVLYKNPTVKYASLLFFLGTLVFSGSLYALAITEISMLGAVTPLGGLLLIAGWLFLAFSFKNEKNAN